MKSSIVWVEFTWFSDRKCVPKFSFLVKKNSKFIVYFLSKPEILTKSAGEPPINLIPGFGWTNFRLRILWIFVKFSTTISYWINHFSVHLLNLDGFLCPAEISNRNVFGLIFHWKNMWFYVDQMTCFLSECDAAGNCMLVTLWWRHHNLKLVTSIVVADFSC